MAQQLISTFILFSHNHPALPYSVLHNFHKNGISVGDINKWSWLY